MLHYVKLSLLAPANSMALRWPEGLRAQRRGGGKCICVDGKEVTEVVEGNNAHCTISRLIVLTQPKRKKDETAPS